MIQLVVRSFEDAARDLNLSRTLRPKYVSYMGCRFTTYRHRFARAAPAPRAKRNDAIQRIVDVRRPSIYGAFNFAQRAALRAAGQATSGKVRAAYN